MHNILKPLQRQAFTMLELIFVIIILGIVSSISAEVIARVYESYIVQRATHKSSLKTELAAIQIVNRLTYAIPDTIIGRKSATNATYRAIDNFDDSSYTVLQWTGYDADSFGAHTTASQRPGWSGLCDIDANATTATNIVTPGSQLALTNTIIGNLSNSTRGLTDSALFFASTYDPTIIGYGTNSTGLSTVNTGGVNFITLDAAAVGTRNISELYKLAWSSYAIVPIKRDGTVCADPANEICDLELRYNFQPWAASSYSNGYDSQILLRNVTVFRFVGTGNTIRFKLCQRERIGEDFNITTCKEKAVIR